MRICCGDRVALVLGVGLGLHAVMAANPPTPHGRSRLRHAHRWLVFAIRLVAEEPVTPFATPTWSCSPIRSFAGEAAGKSDRPVVHGRALLRLARQRDVVEAVIGSLFLLLPASLGASVRYRASSTLRDTEQVRLRERERLARELHDSVAHHVSAIAIQAQAGWGRAASRPEAALEALEIIEEEASRTLAEMRTMVGILRNGEAPERAPQRGVADIERLALGVGEGPRVEVELSGDLEASGRWSRPRSTASPRNRSPTRCVTHAMRPASASGSPATRPRALTVRDDGD